MNDIPTQTAGSTPRPDAHGRVGRLIRQRRLALGVTLASLAEAVGCAKSYLSHIETGRKPVPAPELLRAIATNLNLDETSLLEQADWERTPPAIRQRYQNLQGDIAAKLSKMVGASLDDAGSLDPRLDRAHRTGELHALLDQLRQLEHPADVTPANLPIEVPLVNSVQAGYPTEFTDLGYPARVADEYVRCPDLHDPDAFAARVVGDPMSPDYREGDIVVFSPAKPPTCGADCFVRLEPDQESTFKRVYFETDEDGAEQIRLQPINSAFPPRTLPRERVAGLFAAASVIRML